MEEPIEELYFNWLCAKVLDVNVPIYLDLMRILYRTEFVWKIHADSNRYEDGLELRDDFVRVSGFYREDTWYHEPCSVLEMLIAFAQRAHFQTDRPVRDWFWEFIQNLGLDEFRQVSEEDRPIIDDILHDFVWRTYEPNGHGGMFPMRWPKEDQREVEIWHQFFEYLDEQGLL